ncbi:MAG: PH domain-containing protein [Candidatus Kerfeldbacteria bacterium]
MLSRSNKDLIRYDESVVDIFRPSLVYYQWPLVVFSLVIIGSFFLIYPLLSFGIWGWLIFCASFALGCAGIARTIFIWKRTVVLLTNQRLIDFERKSLFSQHVAECPLDRIQDIRYNKKGIVAAFFNVGTVVVDTGSGAGHIEIVHVKNPEAVKERITSVQKHNIKKDDEVQEI